MAHPMVSPPFFTDDITLCNHINLSGAPSSEPCVNCTLMLQFMSDNLCIRSSSGPTPSTQDTCSHCVYHGRECFKVPRILLPLSKAIYQVAQDLSGNGHTTMGSSSFQLMHIREMSAHFAGHWMAYCQDPTTYCIMKDMVLNWEQAGAVPKSAPETFLPKGQLYEDPEALLHSPMKPAATNTTETGFTAEQLEGSLMAPATEPQLNTSYFFSSPCDISSPSASTQLTSQIPNSIHGTPMPSFPWSPFPGSASTVTPCSPSSPFASLEKSSQSQSCNHHSSGWPAFPRSTSTTTCFARSSSPLACTDLSYQDPGYNPNTPSSDIVRSPHPSSVSTVSLSPENCSQFSFQNITNPVNGNSNSMNFRATFNSQSSSGQPQTFALHGNLKLERIDSANDVQNRPW
ncbi:MAG: hypothetical protein M1819_007439 [Sarea resinae]|nr:MAG: hypothetical protein M1819_007439 [Sarea resinae]